ncbi:hypothetical protein [Desulfonema magnum]|uniref:Uncharacterized protein n=1 Tax=Desulfonema magnum TaxID=45655 RepID=A0A975GL21_9BACT|nr:hypothetical protein [Desulfonema magnum]QTA85199.1 Uncharacterized protein dnm_012040 [Desulfonema magnum]
MIELELFEKIAFNAILEQAVNENEGIYDGLKEQPAVSQWVKQAVKVLRRGE